MTEQEIEQEVARLVALAPEDLVEEIAVVHQRMSLSVAALGGSPKTKPIYGGQFGRAGFMLMSITFPKRGLDETVYCVAHASGFVLSLEETRGEALRMGRNVLSYLSHARLTRAVEDFEAARVVQREEANRRRSEWFEQRRQEIDAKSEPKRVAAVKSISRRRRQIFEESAGKCHYCGTVLTLDGLWHVEHKMPKSLGGGNERTNLVASCAPCNFKKRDRTDVEFKAAQATHA